MVRLLARSVFVVLILVAGWIVPVMAQEGPGGSVNPQRDCQTIVTCRYARGGSYRGCLSSYSCRVCRFVTARCGIAGSSNRVCRQLRCTWG
jgi:hypothetical protein